MQDLDEVLQVKDGTKDFDSPKQNEKNLKIACSPFADVAPSARSSLDVNYDSGYDAVDFRDSIPDIKFRYFSCATMHSQMTCRMALGKPLEEYSEKVYASVCFADICGFNRLCEQLTPDELTVRINDYFAGLLKIVHQYHGDVIKFLGDAVLILWPVKVDATDDVKSAATMLASMCAIQLIRDCNECETAVGNASNEKDKLLLQVHCAVTCGEVQTICVGSDDRWEYLTSGQPMKSIGGLMSEAVSTGDVSLSPQAYTLIQDHLEAMPTASGNFRLTSQLKPGSVIATRLAALGRRGSASERIASSFKRPSVSARVADGPPLFRQPSSKGRAIQSPPHGEFRKTGSVVSLFTSPERTVGSSPETLPPLVPPSTASPSVLSATSARAMSSGRSFLEVLAISSSNIFSSLTQSAAPSTPVNVSQSAPPGSAAGPRKRASIYTSQRMQQQHHRAKALLESDPAIISVKSFLGDFLDHSSPALRLHRRRQGQQSSLIRDSGVADESPLMHADSDMKVKKSSNIDIANLKAQEADFIKFVVPSLRYFVPHAAREAIENGTEEYLAERREISTVFIEVNGLDEDLSAGDVARPQAVMQATVGILTRFEGALRQFVVDDKGCYLICAFGLLGSFHEDDAVRAVDVAVAIRESLRTLGLQCKIGIARGNVFCGLIGSDELRCEYGMVGSSVNLAAHLMQHAIENSILVSEVVYTSCVSLFKFIELPMISAKGFSDPVRVFQPIERTSQRPSVLASAKS